MNELLNLFSKTIITNKSIKVINLHNTPEFNTDEFEKQLQYFSRHFTSVSENDLDIFFESRIWHKEKPGLIIAFYNGYRNNFATYHSLLEKYNFIGWFFIATEFINTKIKNQKSFGDSHSFNIIEDEFNDKRYALSWEELRLISKKHVICSHTKTHSKILKVDDDDAIYNEEIIESLKDIKKEVNSNVPGYCWLGGESYSSCPKAWKYIKKANYKYMIGNYKIEKVN